MKKNLHLKIRAFLRSEEGKVSVKAPLALSVMGGSFLLAQAILVPSVGASDCYASDGNDCITFCKKHGEELSCTLICG